MFVTGIEEDITEQDLRQVSRHITKYQLSQWHLMLFLLIGTFSMRLVKSSQW
jgi:hypothetical protein